MSPSITRRSLVALIWISLSVAAGATCAAPSKPGAILCYPTANASVVPIFNLEGAATGDGLPIIKMILYSDNQKIYEADNNDNFVFQDYVGWPEGAHHLVLNAWDSNGHLFQASASFTVMRNLNTTYASTCGTPSVGVQLCQPQSNGWYPESVVPFQAGGSTAIVAMKGYINGKAVTSTTGNQLDRTGNSPSISPNAFTYAANGWDSKGNVWVASGGIHVYYDGACIKACSPGVSIQSPPVVTDQTSPFSVNATVQNNPSPISAMKAYLDNTVAAESSGPTILNQIEATPGTHLVTVQAWDVDGNLYKSQVTVNVQ